MNWKVSVLILLLLIFVITNFIIITGLVILFNFYLTKWSVVREENKPYSYQYFEFDKHSNSSNGMLKMNKQIKDEEYVVFSNEETHSVFLVSNINENNEEFECSGSCYCGEERRNTFYLDKVLTRGLLLVFSAFSATVAIDIARDVFREKCVRDFSSKCSTSKIVSEVENCQQIQGYGTEYEEEDIKYEYMCSGYCRKNSRLKNSEALKAANSWGNCEKELISGIVKFWKSEVGDAIKCNAKALTLFGKEYLRPFCRGVSEINYSITVEQEKNGVVYELGKRKEGTACVGDYPAVTCMKMNSGGNSYFTGEYRYN